MIHRRLLLSIAVAMLFFVVPAFGSICPDHERLQKLEKLSRETHSTLLLDCDYHHSYWEPGAFLLLQNGRSREFRADRKYRTISSPLLSPDGGKIAYAGLTDGLVEFVIIDTSSGEARVVHSTTKESSLVAWASNGSHLIVYNQGRQKLESMRLADGTVDWNIPFANPKGVYRLSPDLRWIAIEEDQDHPERVYVIKEKLYLAKVDDGEKKYVADGWESAWSQQGDRLAYLTPDDLACYALTLSSGKPKRLFRSLNFPYIYQELLSGPLVWSPDQRFLVFHHSAGLKDSDRTAYIYDFQRKRKHKFLSAGAATVVDWR